MKKTGGCVVAVILCFFLFAGSFLPDPAESALLYKNYIVKRDRGRDILCDPYIVLKDDYILKLFKQRGEIALSDFQDFLAIFRRINPHIYDINLIRPGEQIFIPLRKLHAGEMAGQDSGIVTVPFVTISSVPENLNPYTSSYKVQPGDCVSVLIAARFGLYGTKSYWEGVKLFRLMNPAVVDLDRIYAGAKLQLPDPTVQDEPWYKSLFAGNAAATLSGQPAVSTPQAPALPPSEVKGEAVGPSLSPLAEAASALDAKLLTQGVYHFPRAGMKDYKLDLARFPAMEFEDGTMALLPDRDNYPAEDAKAHESLWKRLKVVPISSDANAESIIESVLDKTGKALDKNQIAFSDHGIRVEIRSKWVTEKRLPDGQAWGRICIMTIDDCTQRTPDSLLRYLEERDILVREVVRGKRCVDSEPVERLAIEGVRRIQPADRRSYVGELLDVLGAQYAPNVSITFPFSGVQIRAVTNLVSQRDGREFLVDFGDLYGDAVVAIERTGFKVVQIKAQNSAMIIETLLNAMESPYQNNPTFLAAKRPPRYNIDITTPGILVDSVPGERLLFTGTHLPDRVVQFLNHQGVRVVLAGDAKDFESLGKRDDSMNK